MIRTKDFILFLLVIFFLGIAISVTLSVNSLKNTQGAYKNVTFGSSEITDFAAETDASQVDRISEIERLRLKLLGREETISAVPSVETPETDQTKDSEGQIGRCGTTDDAIVFARTWPLENVSLFANEGARVVAHVVLEKIPVSQNAGTTTASSSMVQQREVKRPLLQLPLFPTKSEEPTCLPSEIVGVTTVGGLIYNGDAVLYTTSSSEELIGYARDGFPIYGPYSGEVDVCGGYFGTTGYRYAVDTSKGTVLSCFSAPPRNFIAQ